MPPHGSEARTVHRSEGLHLLALHNVLIGRWSAPHTAPLIGTVTQQGVALASGYPSGIAIVHSIEHQHAVPPDEATRREYQRHVQQLKGLARCGAVLRVEEGLAGALTRSVLTGILLLTAPSIPIRYFNRVPELCTWVSAELDRAGALPVSPSALQAVLAAPAG